MTWVTQLIGQSTSRQAAFALSFEHCLKLRLTQLTPSFSPNKIRIDVEHCRIEAKTLQARLHALPVEEAKM
jgi:hypothetical protein